MILDVFYSVLKRSKKNNQHFPIATVFINGIDGLLALGVCYRGDKGPEYDADGDGVCVVTDQLVLVTHARVYVSQNMKATSVKSSASNGLADY